MSPRLPILLLGLAAALASAADQTEIRCTDGSRIRGSLLGIGPDRLLFGADFLATPVPLRLDKVLDLSLPVHRGESKGDHVATVTLSNGDVLRGELAGVSPTEVTLDTWYAGTLKFRRAMVDTLEIQDRPEILYSGPNGLDGWTQPSPDTWTFEQGSLRATAPGSIARSIELPAKTRFAFDLAWRSSPRFRFLFFTDDIKTDHPDNSYELICQGRYVQLHKRWSDGNRSGNMTLGDFANVSELMSKEKCRIEILADRKAGTVRMLVNGRIVKDWSDPDPTAGKHGGGIHFNLQEATPLRISRIEVSTWDGVLEGSAPVQDEGFMEEDDTPQPEPDHQPDPTRIRLRNNDQIAGEMLGIEAGKVKLKTPFGEVSLPVSRLRTFSLHKPDDRKNWELYQIPKRYNGDIRAWFADGSSVTFRLTGVEDGKLKGVSQPFGEAAFDQKAFSRIEFNLYDPALEATRQAAEGW
jgi:hypothetical protein